MEEYITNDEYIAQEKQDGERRMLITGPKIFGLNKKGTEVPLPDTIINSVLGERSHAADFILDGEIIGNKLYVFDILSLNGNDMKSQPCVGRLNVLGTLKFDENIQVVETAYTTEQKRALFDKLKKENKEGIVFKKKNATYKHGRPASGGDQLKFKFQKTATFIVANITKAKRSVGLELIEGSERIFMGKVTISPNYDVPEIGDLVEVRYLYAYKGGAIFQPVYLGKRPDSDLTDCTMKQIIYKAER